MREPHGPYEDLARQVREKRERGERRERLLQLSLAIHALEHEAIALGVPQVVIAHLLDARNLLELVRTEGMRGTP